jgi:hypothetical protein
MNYVIPNVGTMSSTALTDAQAAVIIQNLVLLFLGITPSSPTDEAAYGAVRIEWPVDGDPAWLISEDVAFVRVTEAAEPYNAAHEVQQPNESTEGEYPEQTVYTRGWNVDMIFYGPNSFDHARQVKTCLYQDFSHDILSASNLYTITSSGIGTARRSPELFQNQWWPRTDFSFRMYEQVTESLTKPAVESVEIIISTADGIQSDIVVS